MPDKYVSFKKSVTGFSFANLGVFYGFGNSMFLAVYSLIIMDMFHSESAVGLYFSAFALISTMYILFSGEIFRMFSKAKIFYASMLVVAVVSFMMSFPIATPTFIALDAFSSLFWILISMSIPLFMSDFSNGVGLEKLHGRYYIWLNSGALFAPMIALAIAERFGSRAPLAIIAVIMLIGFFYFKGYKIVTEPKKLPKITPRKSFRAIWRDGMEFFKHKDWRNAYLANTGYRAMRAIRRIYIPILVIQEGFSKDTLGLLLTLGVIPFIIMSWLIGNVAKKYGSRLFMNIGFALFAAAAFAAIFAHGWWLLGLMMLMIFAQSIQEPISDILFYEKASKTESSRYVGVYSTNGQVATFLAPLISAGAIMLLGGSWAVWLVGGVIALGTMLLTMRAGK